MWVRFPDGEVRHGIYSGTTDSVYPPLYATDDEAWDAYKSGELSTRTRADTSRHGEGEPVVVATNYGGGSWWQATATRESVTSMLGWDERYEAGGEHDGEPPE
jgi:hypothetical protein